MDAKTTDPRTQGAPPGATGPSTPEGPPIKLPHCTIDTHQGALRVRRKLAEFLNRLGLKGQVISDASTREGYPEEQECHQWVRSELRNAHKIAIGIVTLGNRIAERNSTHFD